MWHSPSLLHQCLVIVRFLWRQIQNQHTVHAEIRGISNEFFHADLVDQVEVNVESRRGISDSLRIAPIVSKKFRWRGAPGLNPLRSSRWFHQTIGERIAEWDAEFQNIHTRLVESQRQLPCGFQIGITSSDIDDETFLPSRFNWANFSTMRFMCAKVFEFQA